MKYCAKCGTQLFDEAVICVKCGCPVENSSQFTPQTPTPEQNANFFTPQPPYIQETGVTKAAKIFMIIGTVVMALYTCCIGLAWCLPMTISYWNKIKRGEPISTGFKVCSLLFVNTIAGILMLCDSNH